MKLKKVGLFGGAFDPIHTGHVQLGRRVKDACNLDEIVFMPTGHPPHKLGGLMTPGFQRFAMTELALLPYETLLASAFEIENKAPSFTVDTIIQWLEFHPDIQLFFILGEDSLDTLSQWKKYEVLIELVTFIVVPRLSLKTAAMKVDEWNARFPNKFLLLPETIMDISSTDIRKQIKDNTDISAFIPPKVAAYIKKYKLYENEARLPYTNAAVDDIIAWLETNQTPKRFAHSISVAQESMRLANLFGGDADKAYTAGLLHDLAKGFSIEEMNAFIQRNNVNIPSFALDTPAIWHGFIGAYIASGLFAVDDKDILHAIYYHSTGRANMSITEKIVYVADITEGERDPLPYILQARQLIESDLDKTLLFLLKASIDKHQNMDETHDTYKAYEYYKMQLH